MSQAAAPLVKACSMGNAEACLQPSSEIEDLFDFLSDDLDPATKDLSSILGVGVMGPSGTHGAMKQAVYTS
jgi:hypothetical protein